MVPALSPKEPVTSLPSVETTSPIRTLPNAYAVMHHSMSHGRNISTAPLLRGTQTILHCPRLPDSGEKQCPIMPLLIRKVEMERFSVTSSKSFDQVVATLNAAIGHPDMAEFWRSTHRTQSMPELESTIQKGLGKTGLMLFAEFDHGAIVRKGTGRDTPRMIRLV